MRKCLTPSKIIINPEKTRMQLHFKLEKGKYISGLYGFCPGHIDIKSGAICLNINGARYFLSSEYHNQISWENPCLITFAVSQESDMSITFFKDMALPIGAFLNSKSYIHRDFGDDAAFLNPNLQKVKNYIIDNFSQHVTLSEMSSQVNLSLHYLVRAFKKHYGLPPCSFLRVIRCYLSLQKLMLENMKGIDVAFECGFCDQSHFIREFKVTFGMSPKNLEKLCEYGEINLPSDDYSRKLVLEPTSFKVS